MTTAIVKANTRAVQAKNFFANDLLNRWLRFAGVSEKTALTYKTAINQLTKYFAVNGVERPAREDLENWRDGLIEAKKSPSTVRLYLTSAKIFFRWLAQENVYPNIADNLKAKVKVIHSHKKDALTNTQAARLLHNVKGNSVKDKRDKAIMALMMTAGLRCIEVTRLDVADMINQFGRTYLLIQGKGHNSKDAKVLLPAQVEVLIQDYLKARDNINETSPLFVSTANRNRGQRLSTQSISKMVKANLRSAGLNTHRLTAHSLRHTAATTMIIAGVGLTQVQQVLRHTNINTTMIYNNAVERMKNTAEQIAANAIFDTLSA